ncbi:MAG TPA: rhomboid family intramembrane serine protease [Flavipsychrobacter sp.]|nr:rhomboid family intramembrane serine protease [Flavipsychrobacter sp.]
MFPIGDDNSQRTVTPFVNYLLIAVNIAVFIFLQKMGTNDAFLLSYSTVPEEILTGADITSGGLGVSPTPVHITILTSMFMHGGIAHIAGNMLYLWIFGDNLENVMGHIKYLVFYLLCGVLATLAHVLATAVLGHSTLVPSLGASGAISGVLGGYLLLFPRNKVRVFVFRFVTTVPAIVSLGIWIAMQLVSSLSLLGGEGSGGGVAYAAHIGGFVAGLILVKFFATKREAAQVVRQDQKY